MTAERLTGRPHDGSGGSAHPENAAECTLADLKRVGFLIQQESAPAGHWTWLPLGAEFARVLLEICARRLVAEGYEEARFPSVVKLDSPHLTGAKDKFGDRIYRLRDIDAGLTWNSDPLVFSLVKQLDLALPVRLFASVGFFRNELSGELSIRRGRSFCVHDAHAFLQGFEAGYREVTRLLQLSIALVADTLGPDGWSLQISADANERQRLDGLAPVVAGCDVPSQVNWFTTRTNYYLLQVKVLWGDGPRAFQLSNLQLDAQNGSLYGFGRGVMIVHAAPVTRPERFAIAAFTTARSLTDVRWPAWPTVLSPIQARLLPLDADCAAKAEHVAETWRAAGLRVDIDATSAPVERRLRCARRLMIPYIGLVGPREEPGEVVVEANDGSRHLLASVAARELAAEDFVVNPRLPVRAGQLAAGM